MGWFRRKRGDEPVDEPVEEPTVRVIGPGDSSSIGTDDDAVLDELSEAFEESGRATITIAADDDESDIAYLDEELARDDSSGTVFIDDDGSGDAVSVEAATSASIEPRIAQRRIGVRRAQGRRRLWWVLAVVGIVLVLVAVLAVVGSSLFSVDRVDVTGAIYTDPDALAAVVDDIEGTPILLVDTVDAEEQLEAIPWIESARVTTSFPDRVNVEIRERTPVASMQGGDGLFRVLDREGRVLDVIEGQPVTVAWISGPGTLDLPAGSFASLGYASAASLVTKMTPDIRSRVHSMLVTSDGADLRLLLVPQSTLDAEAEEGRPPVAAALDPTTATDLIEVRFGSPIGDNAQIEKLVRLQRQLDDIGTVDVSVIDVSTAEVTVS
ncbi:MAG: FtsQ-type POTRA domain-containing protein [Actinomycetota bacterium]